MEPPSGCRDTSPDGVNGGDMAKGGSRIAAFCTAVVLGYIELGALG